MPEFWTLGKIAMSDLWPIVVMCIWAAFCIATVVQNSRLLRMFRDRYPTIAARELPMAWDGMRHPEKAIFFFRKRAIEVLRPLPDVWRERQRFVTLVVVTLSFLVALGVVICVLGIVLT